MLNKTSAVLADGSRIEDLVNVATREVQLRALSDPEIYLLEMQKIFGRTWLLLGHESEIPNAGDYVVRDMGSDSVIVSRDKAGAVHVLLNVCPHRGMRVAVSDAGNTQIHKCIHHGWAFRSGGEFIGAPAEREAMHGQLMTKDQLGLQKARVHLYGGLVFATWQLDGPSFDEFLGDTKWYFDMLFCRTDSGLEVLGPPQRFTIRANWKTASEQAAADNYHLLTLHRWLGEIGSYSTDNADRPGADLTAQMVGVEISSPHGHAVRCQDVTRKVRALGGMDPATMSVDEQLAALPPAGLVPALLPQLKRHLSADQLKVQSFMPPQVGGLFPNVMFSFVFMPQQDGTVMSTLLLHAYVPRGPDKLEFVNWLFAEKDTPEELKRAMVRQGVQMFGTSGMVEQDDSDTWPQITASARGAQGRQLTMKYQAIYEHGAPEGWPGPGIVHSGFTKDDPQWHWWLYWRELMLAD